MGLWAVFLKGMLSSAIDLLYTSDGQGATKNSSSRLCIWGNSWRDLQCATLAQLLGPDTLRFFFYCIISETQFQIKIHPPQNNVQTLLKLAKTDSFFGFFVLCLL